MKMVTRGKLKPTPKEVIHRAIAGKKGENKTRTTPVWIRPEAAEIIRGLAEDLFVKMEMGHHACGIHIPSSRVAVDYLIWNNVSDPHLMHKDRPGTDNLFQMIMQKQVEIKEAAMEAKK
jgi:hypothetical protein